MAKELASRVNPKEYEQSTYQHWLDKKLFHGDEHSSKPPYSIVIPPPNVTGSLHIGHALNVTIQDILIRYHKLKGYETMWIPGTDHAGIATQTVVERLLARDGISRTELGRDKFIEEIWKWKASTGDNIKNQLKAMGAACDWDRERFTMDSSLSKAVRKVFTTLYNEGLIYRANYMVNWCVHCHTALSDLEVEFEDKNDFLYHMRYPLADGSGTVEIATTRPETFLADSAVAVNPDDDRYKHLIGKAVTLPVINRKIKIIADSYVDMAFGTGCLKVTPGADPNDFEIGRRHGLDEISAMDESGIITVGKYKGLDRFAARKEVIKDFEELGLMGDIKPLTHSVGHCYRCGTIIEPRISLQWFVKVKPLAEEAIKAVEEGKTRIIPKMWQANYFEWMYNIRDWCISRQIWWGHRIPAWHCATCGHITVAEEDPSACEKCHSTDIKQETDVLDTWFSSGLWPFSTQGWPEQTDTLKKFYPTSTLVTAFDILFFWVARMMMMGLKFMGDVPFRDVYIHALVRDENGMKMSKTKGNTIDPLEMVDKYGADALRFTLAAFAAQGRDIRMSVDRIEGNRNFVNKIWNASRFLFMHIGDNIPAIEEAKLRDEDKWILTKLSEMITKVEQGIKAYEFNDAAGELYKFFWMSFCDWYVELIKERLFNDDAKQEAVATAAYVLERALVAMHPFMPFVTEHIWRELTGRESILLDSYPDTKYSFAAETTQIDTVIELISLIRNIRGEYNVNPGQKLPVYIVTGDGNVKKLFTDKERMIINMARLSELVFADLPPENSASQVSSAYAVYIPLSGLVDIQAELARLNKELKGLEKDYALYSGKLKNERYLEKASAVVIEKDKAKVAELKQQIDTINAVIANLG